MKRIKSLEAFETPIGMGLAYIEPIPTFHPPSLREEPAPKMNKLLQRLLKQQEIEIQKFRHRLLLKQPKVTMPVVNQAFYDPTPIFSPSMFGTGTTKKKKY